MTARRPRQKSREAKEPAGLWLARKKEFQRIYSEGDEARKKYRDWLALRLGRMVPGAGTVESNAEQLDVHVAFRIYSYYAAIAYDEFPETLMPRDGAGDAQAGPMVEKLLTRMLDQADATETLRGCLADMMTDGASAAWWGLPRYPSPVDTSMVNWGMDDVMGAIEAGGYDPVPGMDHDHLASSLKTAASDPRMIGAPMPVQQALYDHALKHEQAITMEGRTPVEWSKIRGRFWAERSTIGDCTVWDTTISDLRYAWWMGRKLLIPMDELEGLHSFDPAAVRNVKPVRFETQDHGEVTYEEQDRKAMERENGAAEVWQFWDRRHETVHYVAESSTEGGHPFYLELDESYPYQDLTNGMPAVGGYFPCTVIAPYKSNLRGLERTFGIPILALAEPHIRQIIRLESEVLAESKRNVRQFGFVGKWRDADKRTVTSGVDGGSWDIPEELWDRANETGVRPLVMPPVSADLVRERDRAWMSLARGVGIPYPALVGESVEDTLGQAEMASTSGNLQTNDLVGQLQRGWAHMAEGARAIAKTAYSTDDVREMLGDDAAQVFSVWRESDVTTDKLAGRFSKAREDLRRTEQIMKALNIVISPELQAMGVRLDPMPLIDELWRGFDLGEPQDRPLSFEEKLAMLEERLGVQAGAQGGAPGSSGGAGPSAEAKPPTPSGPNQDTEKPTPSAMAGAQNRALTAS